MKEPRTISEILVYFEGLIFHGIDLSLMLCHHFQDDYAVKTLSMNRRADWLYRLLRVKPIFYYRVWRRSSFKKMEIPQADYLLLSAGVTRTTDLSFPVFDSLVPSSRLIVFIEQTFTNETNNIPYVRLQEIPYAFEEWRKAVSSLWAEIQKRLVNFQRNFNPNNFQVYTVFSSLCWSVATVLRAEYMLEKARPRLVLAEEDRKENVGIIIQVARKMGIPSATLVHGLRGGDSFQSSMWTPLIADHLIVWGEWMRQDFIQLGIPEDQILVGGYPRLQPIIQKDRKKDRELIDAQGGSRGMRVVVMLSNSLTEEKPAVDMFMDAQNHAPDCYFMVRPHPVENLSWYAAHLTDGLQRVQDPHHWTILQSLAAADIVVGTFSTSCIDAILVGKPVILIHDSTVDYRDVPMLQEAVDRGVMSVADNAKQLARLIQEELKENKEISQSFARECAACLGSEAAHLTAEILQGLALSSVL